MVIYYLDIISLDNHYSILFLNSVAKQLLLGHGSY